MNSLLLTGEEINERVTEESDVRKTRISFELHPLLVLESLLPVIDTDEHYSLGIGVQRTSINI